MSLPTPANLTTMDYAYLGQPFVNVPAKTGMSLGSMDYAYLGQPFVTNPDAPAAGTVVKINIGDVFKDYVGMQINIGDVWKTVAGVSINIGDTWKTVL